MRGAAGYARARMGKGCGVARGVVSDAVQLQPPRSSRGASAELPAAKPPAALAEPRHEPARKLLLATLRGPSFLCASPRIQSGSPELNPNSLCTRLLKRVRRMAMVLAEPSCPRWKCSILRHVGVLPSPASSDAGCNSPSSEAPWSRRTPRLEAPWGLLQSQAAVTPPPTKAPGWRPELDRTRSGPWVLRLLLRLGSKGRGGVRSGNPIPSRKPPGTSANGQLQTGVQPRPHRAGLLSVRGYRPEWRTGIALHLASCASLLIMMSTSCMHRRPA